MFDPYKEIWFAKIFELFTKCLFIFLGLVHDLNAFINAAIISFLTSAASSSFGKTQKLHKHVKDQREKEREREREREENIESFIFLGYPWHFFSFFKVTLSLPPLRQWPLPCHSVLYLWLLSCCLEDTFSTTGKFI